MVTAEVPIEYFPALRDITLCRHAFIERVPGIDVSHDKAEALKRLDAVHREMRGQIGMADWPLLTAQQIHGDKIAVVDQPVAHDKEFAGCDGIVTNQKKIDEILDKIGRDGGSQNLTKEERDILRRAGEEL